MGISHGQDTDMKVDKDRTTEFPLAIMMEGIVRNKYRRARSLCLCIVMH
jgi:hypothetical protein